jgi:ketosteroid isomerase-like protein
MGPAADLEEFIDEYHRALAAFIRGEPATGRLWSRADDATLANPLGPPVRGWPEISETMDRAAAVLRDGEVVSFDPVSGYATEDLAYIVEIERYRGKVAGASEMASVALRVTTIFRREDGVWRIAHRHADTITTARPAESMTQD